MHYFTGKAMWAKVFLGIHDDYEGEKRYTIDLVMTDDEVAKLKETGSKRRPKRNEKGEWVVRFSRPFEHEIVEFGGLPKVLLVSDEGKPEPFEGPIGNESDVCIKVAVYDSRMGKGTRLEAVRVDKLIAYEKPSGVEGEDIGLAF
jgi:hypothetical protein